MSDQQDQTVRRVLAWIGFWRRFGQAWQRLFAWRGRPTWIFGPEPRQPCVWSAREFEQMAKAADVYLKKHQPEDMS